MPPIYLDYNASTPLDLAVAAVMRPLLEQAFGNPSSGHWASAPAKAALERARGQVAALIGAAPDEVVFTSGGNEANNLAIKGTFFALSRQGAHIVTSAIEHPAVLAPCRFLERLGASSRPGSPQSDQPDARNERERAIQITVVNAFAGAGLVRKCLRGFGLPRRLNDGNVGRLGATPCATPQCYTVIFRRFGKPLFLKDFCALQDRWRRGRDSQPLSRSHRKPHKSQRLPDNLIGCVYRRRVPQFPLFGNARGGGTPLL